MSNPISGRIFILRLENVCTTFVDSLNNLDVYAEKPQINCASHGGIFHPSICIIFETIHSDEQPEINLLNDYPNKTGHNFKTNSSISIL